MSEKSPGGGTERTGTLTAIIPQDTSTGVYEIAFGITAKELTLILLPVMVELVLIIRFFSPAVWQMWLIIGTASAALLLIRWAPAHITPREVAVSRIGSLWARLRMPLTDDATHAVPGVVAVHPEGQAVERADGAQVALFEVEPSNASQEGPEARGTRALRLARALDSKLSKTDTPAKVSIRRRPPDPDRQVEDLRQAGDDGHTYGEDERAVAIDQSNNTLVQLGEAGVRERRVFVATWVPARRWLSRTRFATTAEEERADQFDALERRAGLVEAAVRSVAEPRRLGTDDTVRVLREFWTGTEGPNFTDTDRGGLLPTAYAPAFLDAHHKHAEVADMVTATLWAPGWPKYPDPGFLAPVLDAEGIEGDMTWFVGPTGRQRKMAELGARAGKATTEEGRKAEGGDGASAGDAARLGSELLHMRDHMRDDGVDSSEVSFYVTLRAEDTETLAEYRDDLLDAATEAGVDLRPASGATRQQAGLVSTSPIGADRLFQAMRGLLDRLPDRGGVLAELPFLRTGTRTRKDMPPGSVGAMLPFAGGVRQDDHGVLYGMARSSAGNALGLLQVAREELTSPHRFFVGRSGSGKTFRATVNLVEELIRHPRRKAIILDIAENFDGVVRLFGGQKVRLGETKINPFQTTEGADLDRQVTMLTNMFHIFLGENAREGTAEAVRPTLSAAIREAFDRAGVETTDGTVTGMDRQAVMADLNDALEGMHNAPEDYTVRATDTEVKELREHAGLLLSRFKPFKESGNYGFMVVPRDAPETAADLDARVVLYDMSRYVNAGGAEKGMLTMLILSRALSAAGATDAFVNILADEAHDLFRDAQQAGKFESAVRAGRNSGLCFDFLSQADEDFDEEAARIIAKQCSASVWGDLGEIDDGTPERFGWSAFQAETINGSLDAGDNDAHDHAEAMVDIEGDRYLTRFEVGPVAHAAATYSEEEDGPWSAYLTDAIDQAAEEERDMLATAETEPDGETVEEPEVGA